MYDDYRGNVIVNSSRLLGFVVGLSGEGITDSVKDALYITENLNDIDGKIVFHSENADDEVLKQTDVTADLIRTQNRTVNNASIMDEDVEVQDPNVDPENPGNQPTVVLKKYEVEVYVLDIGIGDYEIFLVGAYTNVADLWLKDYSSYFVVLKAIS